MKVYGVCLYTSETWFLKKNFTVYGLSRVLHLGPQGQRELIMNQPEVRLTVFVVPAI